MSVNATAAAAMESRVAADVGGSDYQNILRNPKFQALVSSRSRFGWTLSILMLVIYLGFILLVAFDKPLLAQKIGGGTTSLGIVLGLGVILSAFVLTGIYVVRANGRFDELTEQLKREVGR
jgi:uncharacterized membrane protein (DUF485 family)